MVRRLPARTAPVIKAVMVVGFSAAKADQRQVVLRMFEGLASRKGEAADEAAVKAG